MRLPLGMIDAMQICVRPNTAQYNVTLTELPTSNQRKHINILKFHEHKKYEQYSHFAVTYSCFQISGICSLSLENIYTHDLYFVYQNFTQPIIFCEFRN